MAEYRHQRDMQADPDRLFDYLSDVSHLPEYFSRMTKAEQVDDEEVRTQAVLDPDDGSGPRQVEGTAWFEVDQAERRLQWGSEGDNDYYGEIAVAPGLAGGSRVTLSLHTSSGHEGIDEAIAETLDEVETKIA